ncbi:RusA family crossover junction endodeoxyribonuclease [Streptomyces sp. BK239]|uniref:RusA family crossover junction endodeoxyribonuclease n=1 Tax=Streptomyces sp. BK239 TaxID=2512155 RepID=UPI00102C11DC|nr:RusA family crossover junction endodeoxyribonuclease [Streptomyces sp. BK239]RZU14333.1 endodeoxyribonuclease RusA [Streptomyces sp. BK239]
MDPLDSFATHMTSDMPPAERIAGLLKVYSQETGDQLSPPLAPAAAARVRAWMVSQDRFQIAHKEATLRAEVHSSVSSKASWLQQSRCTSCDALDFKSTAARPTYFAVPVPPFTKQNKDRARRVNKAVRREMERTHSSRDPMTWKGLMICASVVAVQSENRRLIDVDNAAKAVLDTLSKTVIIDDRYVQHLRASRLIAHGTEGYYLIGLSPVHPLEDDVVERSGHVVFAGLIQPPQCL